MLLFKKSSPKRDVRLSNSDRAKMNWFRQATDKSDGTLSPLDADDVLPRTEFTASRQALNNICIEFGAGESSGATTASNNKTCENKFCCDTETLPADDNDDKSIKQHKISCKSPSTDSLRRDGSIDDLLVCRQPSKAVKNVKNSDYIIHFDPYVDYGRIECPDSPYPSIIDYSSVRFGHYVQLKSQRERNCSENFDLFSTSDKLSADVDKSPLNYELLSNVEAALDQTKYNLLRCKIYNAEFRKLRERLGFPLDADEDFNDDNKSTRMTEDTRAIKDFYKLSVDSNLLLHFHGIVVETGRSADTGEEKTLAHFLKWLVLKGKEIKEEHQISDSWIKAILKFFTKRKTAKSE